MAKANYSFEKRQKELAKKKKKEEKRQRKLELKENPASEAGSSDETAEITRPQED